MTNVKVSILLTAPFVDTVSDITEGEPFSGNSFRRSLETRKITLENRMISAKDNEKIKGLQGDLLAVSFNFFVPIPFVNSLCDDIAKEIFQHKYFSPNLRILVEGENGSSVIPLASINVQELAEKIQEMTRNM